MKIVLNARLLALAVMASGYACGSSTTNTATGTVTVTVDATSIKNDGTKANFTAKAKDPKGNVGPGSITFTALYGDVNGTGASTAVATADATGSAKVTYACNVASDSRCVAGSIVMIATWNGINGGAPIVINGTGSTAPPGTDGGTPSTDGGTPSTDGGTPGGATAPKIDSVGVTPNYLIVSTAASVPNNLPGTATALFHVSDQAGAAFAGANVAFSEQPGEGLVALSPATATSDASGNVTVTITSKATPGTAHLKATVAGGPVATVVLPVIGAPSVVIETAVAPDLLGIKGSGIQETGLMTFLVTDSLGTPVPGVTVTFAQGQPTLVTLGNASSATDLNGKVAIDYSAGPEVGVSSISATVVATAAVASHPIAVRGARPSASGFYFRCSTLNLPVYTTTLGYETSSCVVRLKDRYGNRVGIPTPVNFATEAGAISASAVTKPFSFATPTDPEEGTITVTFSSDLGNGFSPVATTPLLADPTQFPKQLTAEPSRGSNCTTASPTCLNPRDQLVTIIAMVRGEEAFVDANHNGQYDTGELFVDQGDPFIDANDNDLYDSATEVRFCGGANCASYSGPNGLWDADRTIWAPAWVVFTGAAGGGAAAWAPTSCADYTDNDLGNASIISTTVRFLDNWLNTPALGTTEAATLTTKAPSGLTLNTSGGFGEFDGLGSMDVTWERVSAADHTKDCTVATTTNGACVMKTEFGTWDAGYRLGLQVVNGNKTPAAAVPGHACGAKTALTNVAPFDIDVVTTTKTFIVHSGASGTFGY